MVHFYHLLTDEETDRELVECMKRREIHNKFLYFGAGAQTYYDIANSLEDRSIEMHERVEWLVKHVPQGAAVISLGCGNCEAEAALLGARPDLKFIGVDSSRAMLELARDFIERQAGHSDSHYLLCADISHSRFTDTVERLCREFGVRQRVYLFVDNTIANTKQSEIMDTLYNTMHPGDQLLFDVVGRPQMDALTDAETALSYETPERIAIEEKRSNIVLRRFGWSAPEDGNIVIQIWEERECGALAINFAFRAARELQGVFREQSIHLLEGEYVRMLSLRRFHIPTYMSFLGRYGFDVVNVTTTRDYERVHAQKR